MKNKVIFVFTILAASRLSHAQHIDTTKAVELNPVTITATRSEKDPMDVGRSITVISNEKIKASGANTVAELLSMQEGIYIVGTGQTPGQIQNIFMRGANSNQTLIMVDGVRLTEPSATDNAIDVNEVSLANIDRVEIVRGSHSTLYGSSAIGGVINIITKKNSLPGVHTDVDVRAGEFGTGTSTFSQDVFLNYTHKSGLYANAEIYNNNTKGLDATIDTVTNPKDYGHNHRDRDGFTKTDLIGKIGYKTGKLDMYASYKSINQKADIDAGAYTDDPAYTVAFKRNLYTYGASYKVNDKFNLRYIGGMTDMKRTAIDDSSIVDYNGDYNHNYYKGVYKGNTATNELQANFQIKGLNAVAGGAHFNEKMTYDALYYSSGYTTRENLDSLQINVTTISQFAHLNVDGSIINDKYKAFAIGLGARNTQHSLFGNNLTYEINPSVKVSETAMLYAAYTTGFNAPSLYELYSPDRDPTSLITRGNKTLKPETSTSLEFGFKERINDRIFFSVSYFKTVVQNSIDYVYMWAKNKNTDSLGYADYRGDTYLNIGKQTNQGMEFSLSSKINEKLFFSGNLSLISGRLEYDPSKIDTSHTHGNTVQLFANGAFLNKSVEAIGLVRRPGTGNLNLTYKPVKKLSLTANVRYAGPRSDIYYSAALGPFGALASKGIADYALFDVIVRYSIMKGLSAGLRAENLFNVKYSEIYGYTTRGRGFYVNLRYTF